MSYIRTASFQCVEKLLLRNGYGVEGDARRLHDALRMAGAGGQAGGSPRALVPKGLVGSAFSQKSASSRGWSVKVSSL